METIMAFITENYIWFLIITIILIFALIGYLVDTKKDERFSKGVALDSEITQRMEVAKTVNISMNDMVADQNKRMLNNQITTPNQQMPQNMQVNPQTSQSFVQPQVQQFTQNVAEPQVQPQYSNQVQSQVLGQISNVNSPNNQNSVNS